MADINVLREKIDAANKAYWTHHKPIITDTEYDRLVEQLRILAPDDPRLTRIDGTPGQTHHEIPMLSLDKKYSHEEIIKWCKSVARTENEMFSIQPKYDGVSGKLVFTAAGWQLSTRGDGFNGEDVSRKIGMVRVVTNNEMLDKGFNGNRTDAQAMFYKNPVYGELIISNDDFDDYFRSGQPLKKQILRADGGVYNTQRNAVAGLLGAKESNTIEGVKPICFVDYNYVGTILSIGMLSDKETWEEFINSTVELGYPVDGMVIKLVDTEYAKQLGATQHHPRGMMAYKFINDSAMTKLEDIVWENGMRSITPVAIVTPVTINGSTISRATLFNLNFVLANQFMIGDTIQIERAGDVIPHVCIEEHTHNPDSKLVIPQECPTCHWSVNHVRVEMVCSNPNCPGTKASILLNACKQLKFKGFGRQIVNYLVDHGITELHQVLALTPDRLIDINGIGPKVAANLCNAIEMAKPNITPCKLLAAMSIPLIGKTVAAQLLSIRSIEELTTTPFEQLLHAYQTAGVVGKNLCDWLNVPENRQNLALSVLLCTALSDPGNNFDMTVCFSGHMINSKQVLLETAAKKGYQVVDNVTRELDLLVVPEYEEYTSDKLTKARRYGIQVLTELQFIG